MWVMRSWRPRWARGMLTQFSSGCGDAVMDRGGADLRDLAGLACGARLRLGWWLGAFLRLASLAALPVSFACLIFALGGSAFDARRFFGDPDIKCFSRISCRSNRLAQ